MRRFVVVPLLLLSAGCASGEALEGLEEEFMKIEERQAPSEAGLAERADLDRILAIARQRYPGLRESLHRARAMSSMADASGRLTDPMLTVKVDDQPVSGADGVRKLVVGLEQSFPFPGKLGLERDAAAASAEAMLHEQRLKELDLAMAVKRAYYEYYRWVSERDVRHEHIRLLGDMGRLSEARYAAGQVPQQDPLMSLVEQGMVQTDVYDLDAMIAMARVKLNLFMDRSADAPLGVPAARRTPFAADVAKLTERALATRPEIAAAQARIRSATATADLASRHTWQPDFFVGVEYMQMRDETDEAAVMAGLNLPWFSGRRSAEAEAAQRTLAAEEAATALARNMIAMEVRDAALRLQALDRSLDLLERELLDRSRQSVEAVRSGYENAKAEITDVLTAERMQRDVQLAWHRTLAARETAVAELERAVGSELRRSR